MHSLFLWTVSLSWHWRNFVRIEGVLLPPRVIKMSEVLTKERVKDLRSMTTRGPCHRRNAFTNIRAMCWRLWNSLLFDFIAVLLGFASCVSARVWILSNQAGMMYDAAFRFAWCFCSRLFGWVFERSNATRLNLTQTLGVWPAVTSRDWCVIGPMPEKMIRKVYIICLYDDHSLVCH